MIRGLAAISIWLIGPLLGLSAGFYYTVMPFFGRTGVFAALEPVTFAAALGYYVGGGRSLAEEGQAIASVPAFSIAFVLWTASRFSVGSVYIE